MYEGFARRRQLTTTVLCEMFDDRTDVACLRVEGLGAYLLLKGESGLHQFDRRAKERVTRGREIVHHDRELVRVDVLPAGPEMAPAFRKVLKAQTTPLKPRRRRLLESDTAVSLFHTPSVRSLALWTSGPAPKAIERAAMALHTQLAAAGQVRNDTIVRYYDLHASPRVRDARTGRSTGDVGKVLKGHLEPLLYEAPPKTD
jgi:hypothetical protein